MIAALNSNDTTLMSILSIIYGSDNPKFLDEFLHHKNDDNETIMQLVIAQGTEFAIHCDLINKMERDFHRNHSDLSKESLDECLRSNIGPHRIAEKSIQWENDFNKPKTCWKMVLIFLGWCIPFSMFNIDLYTDVFLVNHYRMVIEESGHDFVQIPCRNYEDNYNPIKSWDNLSCNFNSSFVKELIKSSNDYSCTFNSSFFEELIQYPSELSSIAAFNYSLVFLLLPLSSYLVEWILYNKIKFHETIVRKVKLSYLLKIQLIISYD